MSHESYCAARCCYIGMDRPSRANNDWVCPIRTSRRAAGCSSRRNLQPDSFSRCLRRKSPSTIRLIRYRVLTLLSGKVRFDQPAIFLLELRPFAMLLRQHRCRYQGPYYDRRDRRPIVIGPSVLSVPVSSTSKPLKIRVSKGPSLTDFPF